jgi:hypothetical protein
MTGSPEDGMEGIGGTDDVGGGGPDPLETLLRPATEFLPAPSGAFERIRRRAARRRRVRAAAGGSLAVAVLAGSFYLVGAVRSDDSHPVETPPFSTSRVTTVPSPTPSDTVTGTRTGKPTQRPPVPPPTGPASHAPDPTTTGASPSSTPTSNPTTPAGTPMCATSQLTASLGGSDAGAGNLYRYLVITNHSGTACHLTGYPGLSMLDGGGKQIGQPATRQPMDYQPVVLAPGASASDTIHTTNHMGTCLPESTELRIYPPGNLDPLVISGQVTDCGDLFSVTPFLKGSTGNPPA